MNWTVIEGSGGGGKDDWWLFLPAEEPHHSHDPLKDKTLPGELSQIFLSPVTQDPYHLAASRVRICRYFNENSDLEQN